MSIRRSIVGKRFGRLTVLEEIVVEGRCNVMVRCLCDCGVEKTLHKSNVTRGATKSCGCLNRELAKQRETKHGKSGTREHKIWLGLRKRCYNKNVKAFPRYGGRGIAVCDRWKSSFENFFADMGLCPEGFSIERLDNNGDYSPENCVWASCTQQVHNRSVTRWITFDGVTLPLDAWANRLGLKRRTLYARIVERNWSVERAFTTPVL